jgi:transposase
MTAEKKLAHQRLSLLELAEALGSVSEACRRRGVSRTRFYECKRRFETLKDLPPVEKSHRMTTPEPVVERVLEIALEHPAWGCNRVSDWLSLQGMSISPRPRCKDFRTLGAEPLRCGADHLSK